MKKLLATLAAFGMLLSPTLAFATANTWHLNIRNSTDDGDINYDLDQPDPMLGYHVLTFDGAHQTWLNLDLFRDDILNSELPQYHFITAADVSAATSSLQSQINALSAGSFSTSTVRGVFSAGSPLNYNSSTGQFSISTSTALATPTQNGFMSALDKAKLNALSTSTPQHVERIRVQTDSSGAYTFTFANAFSSTPVASVDVENTTAGITQAYISSISTTALSIQTARAVNVLGLLTLQSSPQLTVDIVAMDPQ